MNEFNKKPFQFENVDVDWERKNKQEKKIWVGVLHTYESMIKFQLLTIGILNWAQYNIQIQHKITT